MKEKLVSQSFLGDFTDCLKNVLGNGLKVYSEEFKEASFPFSVDFDCEEQLVHAERIRSATDKIMAIVSNPHIKAATEEVIIHSELSGALSHESFSETMRDPKLWKRKNGGMSPEFVHTLQNTETLNTYENQFISMFIDELAEDVDLIMSDISPLVESLQEHFERTDKTFGQKSMFKEFAKSKAPYTPFMISSESDKRDELLLLVRKLQKRLKNLKGTEFYRLSSNKKFNRSVIPTNILIHDPKYNYCYKMHVSYYSNKNDDSKNDALYYNYVITGFAKYFATTELMEPDNSPSISIDEYGRIDMQSLRVRKDNFSFIFRLDRENNGIECKVFYMGGKKKNNEKRKATYYLIVSHSYTERNQKTIQAIIDSKPGYDDVLLITAKNVLKQFADVINLSYYRKDGAVLIRNVLASMMMLFESSIGLYRDRCPFCGSEEISFTGENYICAICGTAYSILPQYNRDLVWLTSIGRRKK